MWLLDTALVELKWFDSPEDIGAPYAILSHVWQGDSEQTFQDLAPHSPSPVATRGLESSRSASPVAELAHVSQKIRRCCTRALADGYAFVWIDTCCNKTSSAELSEAINSMFDWYAKARVCYAFLYDVPPDDSPSAPASAFRRSVWFTRGWTLQELVAPLCVVFLAHDWTPVGTKAALAPLVQEITGIDAGVLTFHRRLDDISIARRMSWAAHRRTRRLEDEAYCLMGIFGVNMPTIYGEGAKAFRRLQEEIMRHSADQTLFAWGDVMPQHILRENLVADSHSPSNSLFAPSPAAFSCSASMSPISAEDLAFRTDGLCGPSELDDLQLLPEFTLTSHGVRCRLPVINGGEYALAVLACYDTPDSCVALVLRRRRHIAHTHPHFLVGAYFAEHGDDDGCPQLPGALEPRKTQGYRLMRLMHGARHSDLLSTLTQPVTCGPRESKRIKLSAQQTEVYIAHRPSVHPHPWLRLTEPMHIAFPPWFATVPTKAGFTICRIGTASAAHASTTDLQAADWRAPSLPESWTPDDTDGTLALTFAHRRTGEVFTIHLGQCDTAHGLWASVTITPAGATDGVYAYVLDRHPDPTPPTIDPPLPATPPVRASGHSPTARLSPATLGSSSSGIPATRRPPTRKASMDLRLSGPPSLSPPTPAPSRHRTRSPSPLHARFGCAQYHLNAWATGARAFGDSKRTVRLAFSRWPRGDTYALDVALEGSVYAPEAGDVHDSQMVFINAKNVKKRKKVLAWKVTGGRAAAVDTDPEVSVLLENVEPEEDGVSYPGALPAIVVYGPQ